MPSRRIGNPANAKFCSTTRRACAKARSAGHTLEEMSVDSTLEAIRFADCVVVVVDSLAAFEKQDLTIADLIAREGRAVVFALSKWDLVENRAGAIGRLRESVDKLLPQIAGAPLIAISSLTGESMDRLLPAVLAADRAWNTRDFHSDAQPLSGTGANSAMPRRRSVAGAYASAT